MRQAQEKKGERKECRKGGSPEGSSLGHAVKSRMTVICETQMGRYRVKVKSEPAFMIPVSACALAGFLIQKSARRKANRTVI